MARYVSAELYNKYKKQVHDMSLATQKYIGLQQQRVTTSLTDAEIAEKLGLSVADVREIRVIAQNDLHAADTWAKSDNEKRRKCQTFFNK